jgi:hypothetical protein
VELTMTDPNSTVQGGAGVAQGPDGRAVVMVVLGSGVGRFQVPVAADEADGFADNLSNAIRAAAAEAKRVNSGIMIATPNTMPTLPPLPRRGAGSNGYLPPGPRGV